MQINQLAIALFLSLIFYVQCERNLTGPDIEKPIDKNTLVGAWTANTSDKGLWIYKIGYQDESHIIGNKVIYAIDSPILIPFTV